MRLSPVPVLWLWLAPSWALSPSRTPHCSIFKKPVFDKQACKPDAPSNFVEQSLKRSDSYVSIKADSTPLELAYNSSVVMQREFWEHHLGTWPRAIDWTAAFIHTAFAGITDTLSRHLDDSYADDIDAGMVQNMVDSYFTQIVGFYFGQDHQALRGQAFDDILWVVLGWLESTNFIRSHSALHYPRDDEDSDLRLNLGDALVSRSWHGNDWLESFALRAREFWDLATQGWGEELCGGGMRWSPHLLVYKNAITNQLWIAASAKMYLDYPGDDIASSGREPRNLTHLESALKGYDWLMSVNMTNDAGLFVDGYHVGNKPENNTKCDVREESVYSYNQGVILTGQRGLWEATGSPDFLRDGHRLTQNVIAATGWDLERGAPVDEIQPDELPPWRGIGRAGVLEERCDSTGECSQNGQTFKGIYYHHLTYFCMPLTRPEEDVDGETFDTIAAEHAKACKSYLPWIAHNAEAALATRDSRGVFGEWWGADKYQVWEEGARYRSKNYSDYRNFGIPDDDVWTMPGTRPAPLPGVDRNPPVSPSEDGSGEQQQGLERKKPRGEDPNDRGRGRTVETQNSGMSVVRAWWELSEAYSEKKREERSITSIGVGWLIEQLWRLMPFWGSLFWRW